MFRNIGPTELFIILLIVLVIFGGSRVGELGGAMGKAIREFRREVSGPVEEDKSDQPNEPEKDS